MEGPLIDFEFLYEVSGEDPVYIYEVLQIFLNTTPPGLQELEQMIRKGEDWNAIGKQAHFLKSGVSVIKVRGAYDQLAEIEKLTKGKNEISDTDKTIVKALLNSILATFNEAQPVLIEMMEKNKPQE
jgi:HPt (histidine-containing phosphotransfer) domain-containing protein